MMVTTANVKNASPNTGSRCRSGRNGGRLRPASAWALLYLFCVGINIDAISRITFGLGIALAAGTGVLYAALYTTEPFMGLNLTLKYLAVIIIGGVGSLPGAFVGGLVIALSEGLTSLYVGPHWAPLMAFALLVLALLIRPQGLLGKGTIEV